MTIDSLARNWWALALRGVDAILFGALLLGLSFRLRRWRSAVAVRIARVA